MEELHVSQVKRLGMRELRVELERCDKIWETLQLIRNNQDKSIQNTSICIKEEPDAEPEEACPAPPMTFIPNIILPLHQPFGSPINQQAPTEGNQNCELQPQFQLSVKSRVNLYHCELCSKEYCDEKSFIHHREKIHGIMPKRLVSRKSVQSKSGDSQSNVPSVVEKITSAASVEKSPVGESGLHKCELCNLFYKNLKKHYISYHKIKSPTVLRKVVMNKHSLLPQITTEKDSIDSTAPSNNISTSKGESRSSGELISTKLNKRKQNTPSTNMSKKFKLDVSREEETAGQPGRLKFGCSTCDNLYCDPRGLRRHQKKQRHRGGYRIFVKDSDNKVSEVAKSTNTLPSSTPLSNRNVPINNDKDNNEDTDSTNISQKIPMEEEQQNCRSPRGQSKNSSEKTTEYKCLCGRLFRNAYILFTHKLKCNSVDNVGTNNLYALRSKTNRDSSISIRIKKKNNSYEIVDQSVKTANIISNEPTTIMPETCTVDPTVLSTDKNGSEVGVEQENLIPEASKYSKDHCVLKLQLAEEEYDIDVENDDPTAQATVEEASVSTSQLEYVGKNVLTLRQLCKKYFIKQGLLPKEETTHECTKCNMFFGSEERLSKHLQKHRNFRRRCDCGELYFDIDKLDAHVSKSHPRYVVCPYCEEKFQNIVGLSEHICLMARGKPYTETFNENYPCPCCNIVFSDVTWLDSHLRSKHLDDSFPFQCYKCEEKFISDTNRYSHINRAHADLIFCFICNKKFQTVITRQKHEAYHQGVGFPCHDCKKTYRNKQELLKHMNGVHNKDRNETLLCFICKKIIKIKTFRRHVYSHKGFLDCELCDRIFDNQRNLKFHIANSHSREEYPLQRCKECSAAFLTKHQLKVHIVIESWKQNEKGIQRHSTSESIIPSEG